MAILAIKISRSEDDEVLYLFYRNHNLLHYKPIRRGSFQNNIKYYIGGESPTATSKTPNFEFLFTTTTATLRVILFKTKTE